jgi:hypothetical protein
MSRHVLTNSATMEPILSGQLVPFGQIIKKNKNDGCCEIVTHPFLLIQN